MSDDKVAKDREEVDGAHRGRPGRRSVEERKGAVLELMSGKATVDQLARRFGVRPETIEGWRTDAPGGIEEALRRGTGRTPREMELERENRELWDPVTDLVVDEAPLKRELDKCRPASLPARSRLPARRSREPAGPPGAAAVPRNVRVAVGPPPLLRVRSHPALPGPTRESPARLDGWHPASEGPAWDGRPLN